MTIITQRIQQKDGDFLNYAPIMGTNGEPNSDPLSLVSLSKGCKRSDRRQWLQFNLLITVAYHILSFQFNYW